jgi:hypothetical protein
MKQRATGAQNYNKDEMFDSDEILLPHTSPCTSAWGQQTGETNITAYQFTGDKTSKKQNRTPHINKDSTPGSYFMLYFSADGGDQQYFTHRQWTFSSTCHHRTWNVSFSGHYYSDGT